MAKLKTKFPVVLKSSTGTQTGVGVVIVESMRSLRALVQMILLYNKNFAYFVLSIFVLLELNE